MDKFTKQQEDIICELLHCSENKEFKQELLQLIGEDNWSRNILSSTRNKYLTESQIRYFYSLGGHFSGDEVSEHINEWRIEKAISNRLKEQGVSRFLYENEEYLSALREGQEIFEGLDIEKVKNELLMD